MCTDMAVFGRLMASEVISVSGPVFSCFCGVCFMGPSGGADGGASISTAGIGGTAEERRLVLDGAVLFLFRGDALLVGEAGSLGMADSSGSNICDGSMSSPVLVRRAVTVFRVDMVEFAVVWRRAAVDLRGLRRGAGAGVKSSSSSWTIMLSSSSDSSRTRLRRAAWRVGRDGDAAIIVRCAATTCVEMV